MSSRTLVEGTPYLSINSIKGELLRCREKEKDISGVINIGYGNNKLECSYWFEYRDDSTLFVISIDGNNPQKILISEQELQFGIRNYFVCGCGNQACKLFLPHGKTELKCFNCYNMVYESSTINRNSLHGRLFYRANRTIKLANLRSEMNRIFYKSRYTKRFERYLKLCDQAGLHLIVEDARELMKSIKDQ